MLVNTFLRMCWLTHFIVSNHGPVMFIDLNLVPIPSHFMCAFLSNSTFYKDEFWTIELFMLGGKVFHSNNDHMNYIFCDFSEYFYLISSNELQHSISLVEIMKYIRSIAWFWLLMSRKPKWTANIRSIWVNFTVYGQLNAWCSKQSV